VTYTPQNWIDGSGGGTPLSAARLTYIEKGIQAGHALSPGVFAADTFDRAGGPPGNMDTGQSWVVLAGTAAISSSKMVLTGTTTVVADVGTPDVDVTATITHIGGAPGIVIRSDNANNDRLAVQLDGTNGFRFQNPAGPIVTIPMGFTTDGTRDYRLRVVALGNMVRAYLDGELLINWQLTDAQQTTYSAFTRVGFRSTTSGGQFDNFAVARPELLEDNSPVKQVNGAYTLIRSDVGKTIEQTSTSSVPFTVPANTFPTGAAVYLVQAGTGAASVIAGTSMTVQNSGPIGGQWSARTLYFRSGTEAVLL
jgi:hypothetical protein